MAAGRASHVVRERWDLTLVVAVGGALGSLARWAVGVAIPHSAGRFAWSTLVVNVSGALLLGLLMALLVDVLSRSRYLRPLLGVGVLGGYTTFSTYMLDTRSMLAAGRPEVALTYVGGTLVVGLLAVWVGLALGRSTIAVANRRAAGGHGHEDSGKRSQR
jgi:fluoride exporter